MILADEAATTELGRSLARLARPGDVITLSGPLGVGKFKVKRLELAPDAEGPELIVPTVEEDAPPPRPKRRASGGEQLDLF